MRRNGSSGTLLSSLSLVALAACGMDSDPSLTAPSTQGQAEEASSRELNIRVFPKITSENINAFSFGTVEQVRKYQDAFTVTFTGGLEKSIQMPEALRDMEEEEIQIFLNNVQGVLASGEDLTPFVDDEEHGIVATREFINLNRDRFFENLNIVDEMEYDERLLGIAMDLLVLEYFDVQLIMNMMAEAIALFQTAIVRGETCYRDMTTREEMYICEFNNTTANTTRTQKINAAGEVVEETVVDNATGEVLSHDKDDDDDRSLWQKICDFFTGKNGEEEDEDEEGSGSSIIWESEGRFPMIAHYIMGSYALNILLDAQVHMALTNTFVNGHDLQPVMDLVNMRTAELYQSDLLSFDLQSIEIRQP